MKARVFITLKNGVLDPQGKAIGHALNGLGFANVGDALTYADYARNHPVDRATIEDFRGALRKIAGAVA